MASTPSKGGYKLVEVEVDPLASARFLSCLSLIRARLEGNVNSGTSFLLFSSSRSKEAGPSIPNVRLALTSSETSFAMASA